jgi:cytoskeletal protein RodZ
MEKIGRILQEAREQLGLTLEEVERATRIRAHHLEAIERGDLEALPSPVQARGFLGNYSDFLGLDADAILLRYAEKLQSRRNKSLRGVTFRESVVRPSVQIKSRRPRWLSVDLFVASLITLAILAVLIWGGSMVMAALQEEPEATDAASGFLIPSSSPSPAATPGTNRPTLEATSVITLPETVTPTQPIIFGLTEEINLQIIAEKRTWVSVDVDGVEAFRGRVTSGQSLDFIGEQVIEVMTGNGAGVRVIYNGQDQGLMGDVGEVVVRLWSLEGSLSPTPTQTRTPTLAPPATQTPITTPTAP